MSETLLDVILQSMQQSMEENETEGLATVTGFAEALERFPRGTQLGIMVSLVGGHLISYAKEDPAEGLLGFHDWVEIFAAILHGVGEEV